jgi:hypothetical protein
MVLVVSLELLVSVVLMVLVVLLVLVVLMSAVAVGSGRWNCWYRATSSGGRGTLITLVLPLLS